jgi:predicted DNA-binding transcriptional regulator AlpA
MENVMAELHLSEIDLGNRWGISPKTLQRWRCENRGPSYLKLSKQVTYAMEDIIAFEHSQKRVRENSHAFAVQHAANPFSAEASNSSIRAVSQAGMGVPAASPFISDTEAARATKLPKYYFTNAAKRTEMEIPHYLVGKLVRFKLEEIRQWAASHTQRGPVKPCAMDRIAAIFEKAKVPSVTPDPASVVSVPVDTGPAKMSLKDALRLKNSGAVTD